MPSFICETCGTQFAPSDVPPPGCPICLDERQYVGDGGQRWTTMNALAADHLNRVEEVEPGLVGIGTEPAFGIAQRALFVGPLVWDCITLVDDESVERLTTGGRRIETIAISHPHYYSAMVDWADRLDARVLLHEADREHVMRQSPRIELWGGESCPVADGLELHRLGGHFAGGTVCLWRDGAEGRGALLSGDIVTVAADRRWASFMWSYPNLIPLPASEILRIRGRIEELEFDRLYGAWWDRVIDHDAHERVLRSADRYVAALSREGVRASSRHPPPGGRPRATGSTGRTPGPPSRPPG
jgi:hypothetical protein